MVRPDGAVVEPSYWSVRQNNHANLASLALANSITGAATLFRREVLADALPFPPAHHAPFHDHWLGLVALCRGEIAYVDEPLYDYVQHEGAVIGHTEANRPPRSLPSYLRERLAGTGKRASAIYYHDWLQLLAFCEVLRLRCWPRMTEPKRRALRLILSADRRTAGLGWLLGRRARRLFGHSETLDRELYFGYAIAGGRLPELLALGRRRPGPLAPGLRRPTSAGGTGAQSSSATRGASRLKYQTAIPISTIEISTGAISARNHPPPPRRPALSGRS